jgi:hypothetical protein
MAIRGRKPNPTLRLITGSHIKDRPPAKAPDIEPIQGGAVERPAGLRANTVAGKLWAQYIARCHWLSWADSPKALMWCHLQAEYQRGPDKMIASRIAQLRALGSELGLDYGSRERMGVTIPTGRQQPQEKPGAEEKPASPASKYFA